MAPGWLPPAAVFAALCFLAPPAWAQSDSVTRAEALIKQANTLRQKGQDPAALPLMRQAYDIVRTPRTAAQLGLVELALGYWVASDDHLSEALMSPKHPWIHTNLAVLEKARTDARDHVGSLVVEGQPAGAEVSVNSAHAGNFPLPAPIRVGEGTVTIEVRASGHVEQRRTIQVRGATTERVRIDLEPVPRAVPEVAVVQQHPERTPVPAPPPGLPAWRTTMPWILGAAAVTAAGVGVWQHLGWRSNQAEFEKIDMCGKDLPEKGGGGCTHLYNTLTARRTGAYVSYGVAGALGVGAAVMVLWNASAEKEVALDAGGGRFAVSVRGRF